MGWGRTLQFLRKECSTQHYGSFHDPKWAEIIKTRDNYRCQVCDNKSFKKYGVIVGKKKDKWFQAHHLFYKSLYSKLKHNLNNGITLCHWCHKEVHKLDMHNNK